MWLQREKVKHIYYKHMIVEHVVHMVEHADLDPMPSQRAGGNARRRLHHTGLDIEFARLESWEWVPASEIILFPKVDYDYDMHIRPRPHCQSS